MNERRDLQRLPTPQSLTPDDIVVTGSGQAGAKLVDAWGRCFPLQRRMRFGRNHVDVDIAIFNDTVSRVHAEIVFQDGGWSVEDAGSTNGTFVDGTRVQGSAPLQTGQIVVFGDVGFLFIQH